MALTLSRTRNKSVVYEDKNSHQTASITISDFFNDAVTCVIQLPNKSTIQSDSKVIGLERAQQKLEGNFNSQSSHTSAALRVSTSDGFCFAFPDGEAVDVNLEMDKFNDSSFVRVISEAPKNISIMREELYTHAIPCPIDIPTEHQSKKQLNQLRSHGLI